MMKRIITAVLCLVMMASVINVTSVNAAQNSPVAKFYIGDAARTWTTSATYNGSAKKPTLTIKYNGKKLVKGTDYTLSFSKFTKVSTGKTYTSPVSAGKYKFTYTLTGKVPFKGTYKGTRYFTIDKASQPASITKTKTATRTWKIKVSGKKGTGKVTYSDISPKAINKYLNVSKDGKVVLSKNAKKGTYTVKVKIAGTTNYKEKIKKFSFIVK